MRADGDSIANTCRKGLVVIKVSTYVIAILEIAER